MPSVLAAAAYLHSKGAHVAIWADRPICAPVVTSLLTAYAGGSALLRSRRILLSSHQHLARRCFHRPGHTPSGPSRFYLHLRMYPSPRPTFGTGSSGGFGCASAEEHWIVRRPHVGRDVALSKPRCAHSRRPAHRGRVQWPPSLARRPTCRRCYTSHTRSSVQHPPLSVVLKGLQ